MGGSNYSASVFNSTVGRAAATGKAFAYTSAVASGAAPAKVHKLLDPASKNKAGVIVRESRDSDEHPESRAVVVVFDETGSMDVVPRIFVEKLGKLMTLLVSKGYLEHPHVLFGAIGDANGPEVAPLQVGQFEAGNEMDSALTNIYLEGNGGGQMCESYELTLWFLAQYAEMDCLIKRGQKAFLFIIGDELPYEVVKKDQIKRLVGVDIEADIPLDEVLARVQEKFEMWWIMPAGTMYWNNNAVEGPQRKRFGERFVKMANPEDVAEFIAATIGAFQGYDSNTVIKDLVDAGIDPAAAKRAVALSTKTMSGALTKKAATIEGALDLAGADDVARL